MEIIGYLSAIIIGLVMGLIGGGGSILSVPIFVYVFGFDAVTATALSLFVVGVTSLVGSAGFIKQKQIDFQTAFISGFLRFWEFCFHAVWFCRIYRIISSTDGELR